VELWGRLGEAVEGIDFGEELVFVSDRRGGGSGSVPFAPASRRASACVRPRPRAAPDTRTTLPASENSGRDVVDIMELGVVLFFFLFGNVQVLRWLTADKQANRSRSKYQKNRTIPPARGYSAI
jgi:hypothetical protein